MKVKIWDKKESINGKSAEYVLSYRDDLNVNEDIILLIEDNGRVQTIAIPSVLKGNLGLSNDLSALEVGEAYLKNIEEINKQSEMTQQEKQSQEERIKSLENTILELKEVI